MSKRPVFTFLQGALPTYLLLLNQIDASASSSVAPENCENLN